MAPPDRRRIVMNQGGLVTLFGFVATEPRIHVNKDGTPVANMRIGSGVRKIDQETGEWRDGQVSFYTVKCWRSLANNAAICLHKGQPVVIAGKLRTERYEDRSGQQRSEVVVEAETVGFDLRRGVAHFTRNARGADTAAIARGEAIRAGLAADGPDGPDEPGLATEGGDGDVAEMFDDQAIADLEHELDASAAEPAAS
jgi:single-strand DNA-binding protein